MHPGESISPFYCLLIVIEMICGVWCPHEMIDTISPSINHLKWNTYNNNLTIITCIGDWELSPFGFAPPPSSISIYRKRHRLFRLSIIACLSYGHWAIWLTFQQTASVCVAPSTLYSRLCAWMGQHRHSGMHRIAFITLNSLVLGQQKSLRPRLKMLHREMTAYFQ